ncbi:hypothetical protein EZV62_008626 [Acer yangbiense]|uniref:Integrase catalytic domain-containing protein n=1 Tax=Acer yangbiense TaxID=1000413 RepID=A0A5C7IDY7_9ROSI|nr:hypothetical protein EZV62_008626 [Acer yangbiense]
MQGASNNFSSKNNVAKPIYDVLVAAKTNENLWHAKLGHLSSLVLKKVLNGMYFICNVSAIDFCESCKLGKLHQWTYPKSTTKTTSPLELIHTDLWGPSPVPSSGGHRYYILFIDDFSRYIWVYLMKLKSEAFSTFVQFQNMAELQFNRKIKTVQADMGGEFKPFIPYLTDLGVQIRFSCPHSHQQNGIAERKHRHLVESVLPHSNVSPLMSTDHHNSSNQHASNSSQFRAPTASPNWHISLPTGVPTDASQSSDISQLSTQPITSVHPMITRSKACIFKPKAYSALCQSPFGPLVVVELKNVKATLTDAKCTTVISAFFASLERCACVYLTTFQPDDDEEESKDRPRSLRCQPPLRRRHR